MEELEFRTQKGYDLKYTGGMTCSMEDYLEMICRHSEKDGFIRVGELAALLNVKNSSASKMAGNLKKMGLIKMEKYGVIKLTEAGAETGKRLIRRHAALHSFFCLLNGRENQLEVVERIEHFINAETVENLERLVEVMEGLDRKWIMDKKTDS